MQNKSRTKVIFKDYSPNQFEKIDQESVLRTIESIDKALKGKQIDKKVKQKLGYARKN